jgi:hypothetical protein
LFESLNNQGRVRAAVFSLVIRGKLEKNDSGAERRGSCALIPTMGIRCPERRKIRNCVCDVKQNAKRKHRKFITYNKKTIRVENTNKSKELDKLIISLLNTLERKFLQKKVIFGETKIENTLKYAMKD